MEDININRLKSWCPDDLIGTILNEKYLSLEEIEEIGKLSQNASDQEIRVTCIGLYNGGKSSLLNVLIGDFEEITFKVADVRETAVE